MSAFCVLFDLFIECFYFGRMFGDAFETSVTNGQLVILI